MHLRLVLIIALLVPALRALPSVYGYVLSTDNKIFSGLGYLPRDFPCYASFMAQAQENGSLFLRNEYTLEPQDGRFILLYHFLVGRLARLFDTNVVVVWHVVQIVVGFSFFLSLWIFLGRLIPDHHKRFICYCLIAFSGGLEWIVWISAGVLTESIYKSLFNTCWPMIGWNTFESLFNPLWTTAHLVVFWFWIFVWKGIENRRMGLLAVAYLLIVILYAIHAYTAIALIAAVATTASISLIHALIAKTRIKFDTWILFGLTTAVVFPLLISHWQKQDAVFRTTSDIAFHSSQGYPFYLWPVTFGILLPLGLLGIKPLYQQNRLYAQVIFGWLYALIILTHVPLLSPYKYIYLLHVPLCVTALFGIERIRKHFNRQLPKAVIVATCLLLVTTNCFVLVRSLQEIQRDENYFLGRDELRAMEAMRDLPQGGVLSSSRSGNFIPWKGRQPVYSGQWFLSGNTLEKNENVEHFFHVNTSHDWRMAFLDASDIRYIFYGPNEKQLGYLDLELPMAPVISLGNVIVYRLDTQ